MTIGQRIAQKRKEQGLSQEALGEQLGLSRQAIYKWESDSALPEIEKLIALSKLFGVSVGWLLGVEDTPGGTPLPADTGELTEQQLNMVEEIVDRYLAAQPKPKKVRRWPWVLAGLVLCGALFSLFDRLDTLNSQYNALQNNVSHVQNSVDRQIGTITNRVEDILKSQNDLTADYGTEIARASLESNSIMFSVYATPKTFVEGMSAEFSLDNGNGSTIQPVLPIGQTFKAEITCELTDTLTLSVVFIAPDGTRRTQLLDTYEGLYSETLPQVDVQDDLMYLPVTQTETPVTSSLFKPALAEVRDHTRYLWTQEVLPTGSTPGLGSAAVSSIRVGLFKNQSLVAWAESCEKPEGYHGFEDCTFYQLPELQISMLDGDTLQTAAVVTDEYGRTLVCPSTPYVLNEDHTELTYPAYSEQDTDPSHWTFD